VASSLTIQLNWA